MDRELKSDSKDLGTSGNGYEAHSVQGSYSKEEAQHIPFRQAAGNPGSSDPVEGNDGTLLIVGSAA